MRGIDIFKCHFASEFHSDFMQIAIFNKSMFFPYILAII